MQESTPAPKAMMVLYAEEIHMLEGLEDEELERYLDKNPRIVPLPEIDVGRTTEHDNPTTWQSYNMRINREKRL